MLKESRAIDHFFLPADWLDGRKDGRMDGWMLIQVYFQVDYQVISLSQVNFERQQVANSFQGNFKKIIVILRLDFIQPAASLPEMNNSNDTKKMKH